MENNTNIDQNEENTLSMDDVVTLISNKKRYSKGDVKEILEGLIWLMEESVKKGKVLKIRGLGKLYSQDIKVKGINGGKITSAKRHIFRLAKNIRFADR